MSEEFGSLPEPTVGLGVHLWAYSADQMRAYAAQAVAAERERCSNRPLTPQQLDKLIEGHVGGSELTDDEYESMLLFARAVEQAHGIGPNP